MRGDVRLLSDFVENRLRAVLSGCSATAYGRTFTRWSDDLGTRGRRAAIPRGCCDLRCCCGVRSLALCAPFISGELHLYWHPAMPIRPAKVLYRTALPAYPAGTVARTHASEARGTPHTSRGQANRWARALLCVLTATALAGCGSGLSLPDISALATGTSGGDGPATGNTLITHPVDDLDLEAMAQPGSEWLTDGAEHGNGPSTVSPPPAPAPDRTLHVAFLCLDTGAPGPPILVGTQPGSSAFDRTPVHSRATAKASTTSNSLLSA